MPSSTFRWGFSAVLLLGLVPTTAVAQPVIVLDYTYDTNNFFGAAGSPQRVALQAAATRLQNRLSDTLTAITPDANNTWTAVFPNPATGVQVNLPGPTLPQNQILVFAGGRDLTSPTLGIGGPGGIGASGFQPFFDSLGRGQVGYNPFAAPSTQTDFGPWGGAITFDTTGPNWNFALTNPGAGQADFLSVAEHELAHLLGFGTAYSFDNLCAGTAFNGPVSNSLVSGVQVTADHGHWASGTTYQGLPVAMSPSITIGTRKEFTELDYAGLDDLGWQVTPVPEPATVLGVAALGLAGVWGVRRRAGTRLAA